MLTQEQQDFFETFGFLHLKQYISTEETKEITRYLDQLMLDERGGKPFTAEKRQSVYGYIERDPSLHHLAEDDRIYGPMTQILGDNCTWLLSEAQQFVGDTLWHSDQTQDKIRYIKFLMYLDPLTKDTGCLRVIPGSHHEPFNSLLGKTAGGKEKDFQKQVPSVALESNPGDAIIFDMRVYHSAFGASTFRRQIALNYTGYPATQEQVDMYEGNYKAMMIKGIPKNQISQPGRIFSEEFLHSESPKIRSLTSKMVELGLK